MSRDRGMRPVELVEEGDDPGRAGDAAGAERPPGPVRRRPRSRAARAAVTVVGLAAAVVGVVALSPDEDVPGPTPSRSPHDSVAEPAPAPDHPTPPTMPLPTQAEVDAGLGLPATSPIPADLWDEVGGGWVLGVYRPSWRTGAGETAQLRQTLVLAAPDGTTYRLLELPAGQVVELAHWRPGAAEALVTIAPLRDGILGNGVRGWLDLRTGALRADPGVVGHPDAQGTEPALSFAGLDHDGDEIWFVTYGQTGGGGPATLVVQHPDGTLAHRVDLDGDDPWFGSALLDPTGHLLALPGHDPAEATYDLVDLDTGRRTAHAYGVDGRYCQMVGWRTADELLARCRPDSWITTGFDLQLRGTDDALHVVHVDGSAPRLARLLVAGDPAVPLWRGRPLPDGRVVVGARPLGVPDDGSCTATWYALGAGDPAPLSAARVVRTSPAGSLGSRVYAVTDAGCTSDGRTQLDAIDDGARTSLLRPPASTAAVLDGGLDTWAVAGGPSGHSWG